MAPEVLYNDLAHAKHARASSHWWIRATLERVSKVKFAVDNFTRLNQDALRLLCKSMREQPKDKNFSQRSWNLKYQPFSYFNTNFDMSAEEWVACTGSSPSSTNELGYGTVV